MSSKKEPHFWTHPNFDNYTDEDFHKYLNLFTDSSDATYFGESSTGYMVFPSFLERITQTDIQNLKFIFVLRNPIDRIYSHYWWLKGLGSESYSLKEAVLRDLDIEPNHADELPESNYKFYFQFGLYHKWLKKYYKVFDASQIKIITSEKLQSSQLQTLNNCFLFLGLNNLDEIELTHTNKTKLLKYPKLYRFIKLLVWGRIKTPKIVKMVFPRRIKELIRGNLLDWIMNLTKTNKSYPKLSSEERIWLKNLYLEDVHNLKKMTGMNFEEWYDFN